MESQEDLVLDEDHLALGAMVPVLANIVKTTVHLPPPLLMQLPDFNVLGLGNAAAHAHIMRYYYFTH